MEALKVTTDAVLLLHREAHSDQGLEQRDCVHTGDVVVVFLFPIDAAHADTFRNAFFKSHWLEGGSDGAARLAALKLHQAPTCFSLGGSPLVVHCVEITTDL